MERRTRNWGIAMLASGVVAATFAAVARRRNVREHRRRRWLQR